MFLCGFRFSTWPADKPWVETLLGHGGHQGNYFWDSPLHLRGKTFTHLTILGLDPDYGHGTADQAHSARKINQVVKPQRVQPGERRQRARTGRDLVLRYRPGCGAGPHRVDYD